MQVYGLRQETENCRMSMTGRMGNWHCKKSENNEANAGTFPKEMETYAKSITDELLQTPLPKQFNQPKPCPGNAKSQQLIIRDKIAKCPDEVL